MPLRSEADVVQARQAARRRAVELGFSLVEQTKIVTATSELARNTLEYGGGGTMVLETLTSTGRTGIRLVFEDKGPGIADIAQALSDGFTSGGGLGPGLGGAKRLMSEFDIRSKPGEGTTVTVTRWK